MTKQYICIGVPYYCGTQPEGRTEVEVIRESGIAEEFNAEWVMVEPEFDKYDDPIVAVNNSLASAIASHPDYTPLIFASCCCSCIGSMKGLEAHQPEILWYDSHGDFNTPETTPSGFAGGMPLAAMVGRGNEHWIEEVGLQPVDEQKVTVTDARNLDPEEGVMLRDSRVTLLEDVQQLYDKSWAGKPLYIHLDTDVVDSAEMPAMSYPEPNGPTVEELAGTLKHVVNNANVVGILFGLWNNTLPDADTARDATLRLVRVLK